MKSLSFLSGAILLLFGFTSFVHSQTRFHYSEGHFSFDPSVEWERIPADIVREHHDEILKKTGATARIPDLAFKKRLAKSPFNLPYFLVNVVEQDVDDSMIKGYLSSIKKSPQEEVSEPGHAAKLPSITDPVYDEKRKLITFSINSRVGHGEQETDITAHFAVFFFKEGIVTYNFYAGKDDFSEAMPFFKGIIDSVTFDKGYEYESGLFGDALIVKSAIVVGLLVALALLFRTIWVKKSEPNAADEHKG
jgi:hypothetical protein